MANCMNCGAQLEDGIAFCTNCGTPAGGSSAPNAAGAPTVAMPNAGAAANTAAQGNTVAIPAANTTYQAGASQQPVSYVTPNSTAQMPAQPVQQAVPQQMQYQAQPPQNGGNSNKTMIIVVAIVAVIVVIVAAVLVINMVNSDDDSTSNSTRSEQVSDAPAASESSTSTEPPSNANAQTTVTNSDGYILPGSNSRYLSASDLAALSDYDLYLARNEIFARHGRGFKNADLAQYFGSQPWYSRLYSPEEFDALGNVLNDYETQNAKLIREEEQRRNSPYLN